MVGIPVYTHTQSSASSTWTVNHNLGRKPNVDVVIPHTGQSEVVLPLKIQVTSDNQVVITFTSAQTGIVRLS
jgi:hypothetical protein